MSPHTLHDRVGGLGLGAMYKRHEHSSFRDLFDDRSPCLPDNSSVRRRRGGRRW